VEIVVLGCGEAFDESLPNTSLLVRAGDAKFLLDCGYSVAPRIWRNEPDPSALDVIYISHSHADHYFGLPGFLGWMWDEGRTKPLVIVAQEQVLESIRQAMELAYRNLRSRFQFPIDFRAVSAADELKIRGVTLRFAPTAHSSPNLAVRMEMNGKSLCYSGDGDLTAESTELYRGTDVLFHEAFAFEPTSVHATVRGVLEMAGRMDVKKLGLVHVQRSLRRQRGALFEAMLEAEVRCILPEPGDVLFA
jgi:ribonuclease BN (tRNA processing enzyme)